VNTETHPVVIVVVTGLSGSGKSTALRALEDLGYFCVDNMPVALLPKFIELTRQSRPRITHIALVMDVREPSFVEEGERVFTEVEQMGQELHVLFLEAEVETLVRRYSETRRLHPLSPHGSVRDGILQEIDALASMRHAADETIDTTDLTVHDLKNRVQALYAPDRARARALTVNLMSFGFKHGLPAEADLVFDVRFLANPHFVQALKPLTGKDSGVSAYVLEQPAAQTFLSQIVGMMEFVLPLYQAEGKRYLTVAIGCTGGQHRSVAMAEELQRRLGLLPYTLNLVHRDMPIHAVV